MLWDAAFWFAVACTVAGSFHGDRAAVALMCSALFVGAMTWAGAPFALWAWALVDAVTAFAIIHRNMPRRDYIVIACFVPGWAFYLVDDPWRFWGTSIVVIVQMMLVAPYAKSWQIFRSRKPSSNLWDNFLPMDTHK